RAACADRVHRRPAGARLPADGARAVGVMLEELRIPLFVTSGAVVGLGVLLLVVALSPRPADQRSRTRRKAAGRARGGRARRAVGGVRVCLLVLVLPRWVVLAAARGVVVALWARLFGGAHVERAAITRIEGRAAWTESLRDTIAGAVGLEQAIPATT